MGNDEGTMRGHRPQVRGLRVLFALVGTEGLEPPTFAL
jgi:hypothetical protein